MADWPVMCAMSYVEKHICCKQEGNSHWDPSHERWKELTPTQDGLMNREGWVILPEKRKLG